MCGICGVKSLGPPPDQAVVEDMIDALRHRGPDGAGFYRDDEVALGHTRLAIIDVDGGAQPMPNENGDVWVTFNGEIFNFVELTAALRRRGHRFRTRSDTEVIVHAWEEWGFECFARFNGQWAIALWDRRTRELILSRDPYGILPLYVADTPDGVRFASEVKSLFADPAVEREFDPRGFVETLTFWSTVAPQTVYRGIEQVPPGTCMVFGPAGRHEHHYWRDEYPSQPEDLQTPVATSAAELRESLVAATRLRFERSDVPVAAYLSGGIDSTVIAGIIARYTDADVRTFSLRFADREFDEGQYQELASSRLGTDHTSLTISGSDIARTFPTVVRHAEVPLLRSGPAPMYLLAQFVRESGHRVVVSGEGADEVLAGYDIFREAAVRRFWARDPDAVARSSAVRLLYPWMQRSPGLAPAFARSFFGRNLDAADPLMSHRPRWDSTSVLMQMLDRDFAVSADPSPALLARMPEGSARWHPLARAQWLETTTLLPGYILSSQGDRVMMAAAVEGRFPFLDPNVARIAAAMPARHKLMGLDEKHVLKRAFGDLVPREVLARPKQPYRTPDASSFFGAQAPDWIAEVLSRESVEEVGVFRADVADRLLEKCRRGRPLGNTDNMRLIALLSTQLIHRDILSAGPVVPHLTAPPLAVQNRFHQMDAP